MKIYKLQNQRLNPYKTVPFKLEKDIQSIVENNLDELFSLELVRSEFAIKNFRLDTLGFDKEANAFVIIEYKREKNFSVIDQGYTYLSLLLNNKSDFILEYNESTGNTLKRGDVDWTQSKVIFISPYFTEYQKHSINFKDVPFELWEIKRYDNDLIGLVQHKNSSQESIETLSKDPENVVNQVSREVKVYSEEYHFTKNKFRKDEVVELYKEIKDRVISLGDDITLVPRKEHISFKRHRPFFDIVFYTDHLKCYINMKTGTLDDPKGITIDMSGKGHWGNGDYQVKVAEDTDLDYLMFLVKQSYKNKE